MKRAVPITLIEIMIGATAIRSKGRTTTPEAAVAEASPGGEALAGEEAREAAQPA